MSFLESILFSPSFSGVPVLVGIFDLYNMKKAKAAIDVRMGSWPGTSK